MRISSPRLRRLDAALAGLPDDSDAMLLSDLDGFVAGLILCPEPVPAAEWLPHVWNTADDAPLFEDARDARWYDALVVEHRDATLRTLAKGAGRYAPFLEVDARNGDVLWEMWIEGFAMATALRPDSWDAVADGDDPAAAEALAGLETLVAIARDESDLDRPAIDAMTDAAPGLIARWVDRLHAWRAGREAMPAAEAAVTTKIGRNDPCSCGSGAKFKKCCG